MLRTCFPHLVLHEARVWELYDKWGGIVRYVLAKQEPASQSLLAAALASIDLDNLIFLLGAEEIESEGLASHCLLHLKPAGASDDEFSHPSDTASYVLARTVLASPYVNLRVFRALKQRHLQRLNDLLAQPIANNSFAKLYGDMYEIGASTLLLKGGAFKAFDCSTGMEVAGGVVYIPPSTKFIFGSNPYALIQEDIFRPPPLPSK